jgi:hypothetical protein
MSKMIAGGFALLAAAGLAGCASSGSAKYVTTPNPPPPPGYRVECTTSYGIAWRFFYDVDSDCQPVLAPPQIVIRARG